MLVNPKKRRKAKRKSSARKTRTITKYRTRKPKRRIKRRRNPIGGRGYAGKVISSLQDGAVGSLGAIAGTIAGNFLPLPENMKGGNTGIAIQALIGIFVGVTVGNLSKNKKLGMNMAQGAVTVALHDSMKGLLSQAMPNLNMGGYDGLLGMDEYVLNEYVEGGMNGMGYAAAGSTAGNYMDDDYNESLL